ncbi:hypothetical protein G4B88_003114 [Cannabis sativa]|uniref:Uncharacterized protein n=1 Tax=Cannabis sativa TaxID=3483 RepID=A0A7J6H2W1_CANSA|nr:hypothetical protein G4B88_003114 [Cannabis sativa]
MSQSSNSVNSGRRYKEEIQWSRPICGYGFESVSALQELLIIQTESSMAAQITSGGGVGIDHKAPGNISRITIKTIQKIQVQLDNLKNELDRGCNFIMWIEASVRRSRNDLSGLFRRLEKIEANVKQLELQIQGRDEEIARIIKLLKNVKFAICVCVEILSVLLYMLLSV